VSETARHVLDDLGIVDRLRAERAADAALAQRVRSLKAYQARRFERSYADLLADPRYRDAARFFLDELYGPQEFSARDAQFARVVPKLVGLFPKQLAGTVAALAKLHALSETLDTAMARALPGPEIAALDYLQAWQHCGRPDLRQQQIDLTMAIGRALDRTTRSRLLRGALHMMRAAAHAAGLGDLQHFLERGFDTFGEMGGATEFLDIVRQREAAMAAALYDPRAATVAAQPQRRASTEHLRALAQLP